MQNGYGGIDTMTVFPVLYRSFFLFSEQTPVLLDAELGFVDTLGGTSKLDVPPDFFVAYLKYFTAFWNR